MNAKKMIAMLLMLLLAASQVVFGAEQTEVPQVLNIGAADDFKNSEDTTALIYDTLVTITPSFEVLPGLAEQWTVDEDYREYTFQLTKDVVFSDSSPLGLRDFEETLRIMAKARYLSFVSNLESIEMNSNNTLKITFSAPTVNFLNELAKLPVIKAGTLDEDGQIRDYIGTGPFVLAEYEPKASAKLSKNPLHHRAADYALEEVNWWFIPEAQSRKMALISGQVDVIGISEGWPSIPLSMSSGMKKDERWGSVEQNKEYYTIVKGLALNWKTGPLSDPALRQALMYAVDREALNQMVLFGEGQACGHLFNPLFPDGPKDQQPFGYDMDRAKAILKEAGYEWENGKLMKDGKRVVLKQIIVNNEQSSDIAVFMQNALKEIGIELSIESFEGKSIGDELEKGNFDIGLNYGWFEPLISSMKFGGVQTEFSRSGLGYGVNEQAVQAGNKLLSVKNIEELQQAAQAYWAAQYEGCSYLPLYNSGRVAFFNKNFEGFHFSGWVSRLDLSGVRKIK